MRILFVSPVSDPFRDVSTGSAQRTHFLLKACVSCAETDVCAFVDDVVSDIPGCRVVYSSNTGNSDIKYTCVTKRIGILFGKPSPESLYKVDSARAGVIDGILASVPYDFIVVRYVETAIACGLFRYSARLVIDVDDNPVTSHMMRLSSKKGISGMFPGLRVLPDKRVFKYVLNGCHFVFFSNPSESRYPNSSYLPNMPFLKNDTVRVNQDEILFFVGALNYRPNRQGITHFVECVWPFLKNGRPSLTLRIAGECDNAQLIARWKSLPGVEYLGFVDDLRPEYNGCRMVIAPIYQGTGTNIKILEAMAMGKVCVTTPVGVRGFEDCFVSGRDLCVANSDEEFKDTVLGLLVDTLRREEICRNALKAIRENFGEDNYARLFSKCLTR